MSVTGFTTHGFPRWFDTPLGQTLLDKERNVLFHGVRRFHGDTMLWLGPVGVSDLELERCMVRQRLFGALFDESAARGALGPTAGVFRGGIEQLPFQSSTVDAIVVHHGLECVEDARSAMREVARVLAPGGRLLICSFNPYSLWGVRRLYARLAKDYFSESRFVPPARLLDWLAVLGFEIDEDVQYLVYRPPFGRAEYQSKQWLKLRERLEDWRVPFGGVYWVLARKIALGVTPLDASRTDRHKLAEMPLPKPTARHPAARHS